MQKNFPKIPFYLTTLGLVFLVVIFSFVNKKINDNNQKAQDSIGKWQDETSRRDEIRSLDRSIKMIEGERADLETHFAQSSNVVPFLDSIETLGKTIGVDAQVASVDLSKDKSSLSVAVNVTGSFQGIYKFLTLLENFPYIVDFVSVSLNQQVGQDATSKNIKVIAPKWTANIVLKLLTFVP